MPILLKSGQSASREEPVEEMKDCRSTVHPCHRSTAFDTAAEISARRATEPLYAVWKAKRVLNVGSERRLREVIRTVHELVFEIVRAKRKSLEIGTGQEAKQDLLSRFLAAGHNSEAVKDMVISFIMAGRDTTSAAMTWLFWLLSENDDVENKLLQEVEPLISLELGFEELKEMSYMKACLCEAMRLYPPVSWDSKHAANDVLSDGTRVKKGDKAGPRVCIGKEMEFMQMKFVVGSVLSRFEIIPVSKHKPVFVPLLTAHMVGGFKWGKDCEEFKPNRWFDSESGITEPVLKPVSPFKFSVFQAGPRVCIGKEMAFMQMKFVVGSVLSWFEIIPVSKHKPVFVPLLTAHMAGGLKGNQEKRSQWGKDCEEFKPNQWFDSEPGIIKPVLKPISPFKFPVFQAGPRVCIGKEMTFMQMKFVVGYVLSRFEIIPVSKHKPVFVPLLTAHMAGGLKVKIKRREVK
ncbi:hypothetical protein F2Q70_00011185 [Brassica cretica]|uniref:Cytochrome P450 n=1 Tax=Brassica cretica TaxID=69181 RepID=A0A8S9M7E2_BRACR|nr:hypothetical protein F2Q70_00011185 [Brassica cretica]